MNQKISDRLMESCPGTLLHAVPNGSYDPGTEVIVSFPGVHTFAWNLLHRSKLVKGISATCTFISDETHPGYGKHDKYEGGCHCDHIYGKRDDFGCSWYTIWMEKTRQAAQNSCKLIVVTTRDGSVPGKGQNAEIRFLEREGLRYSLMNIEDFASKLIEVLLGHEETRKILEVNPEKSHRISFYGSSDEAFSEGRVAIVSFPGVHGYGWNKLTEVSRAQEVSLATSCVFLPDEKNPDYGIHDDSDEPGPCHCYHLYGEAKAWGCRWYTIWMKQTCKASLAGCKLVVVTKDDGSLGHSQEGEVRFLKSKAFPHERVSTAEFALMLLECQC